MLFALIDVGNGMYRRNERGNEIKMKGVSHAGWRRGEKGGGAKALCEHSLEATTV